MGATGAGKTQYIQNDIYSLLQRDDPPGMVIIDSQGQMLSKLEQLAIFDERLKDRLIIIDPDPKKIQMGMPVEVIYRVAPIQDREGNEYLTYCFQPRT